MFDVKVLWWRQVVGRMRIWWLREGGPYSGIIEMAWEVCFVVGGQGPFALRIGGG